jgi:hypothetical protein
MMLEPTAGRLRLEAVAYGGSTWVGVGSYDTGGNAAIVTSTDGVTWIPRGSGTQHSFNAGAYDGTSRWVALGAAPPYWPPLLPGPRISMPARRLGRPQSRSDTRPRSG